jgi:hypothetical protein
MTTRLHDIPKTHPLVRGLAILLISILGLPAALAGDEGIYLETINRSTGLMGEAPQEELSKTYLAHGKMKVSGSDATGTDMLLDPATGNMTFINHGAKQYYQINIARVKEGMSQPGMEQMRAMVADTKITVQDTGETKQIGEWNCRKYLVIKTGMMSIEQEVWATEDVDFDVNRFTEMMSLSGPDGLLANSPEGQAQQAEMAKIKGYPILTKTRMQMMGSSMETESEVKIVRHEAMPASLFDIPAGYVEREMNAGKEAGAGTEAETGKPDAGAHP